MAIPVDEISRLAVWLASRGHKCAIATAYGMCFLVWRGTGRRLNCTITSEWLEASCDWKERDGELAKAMVEAGLLSCVNGIYKDIYGPKQLTEAEQRAWRRAGVIKPERKPAPPPPPEPSPSPVPKEERPADLFGGVAIEKPTPKRRGISKATVHGNQQREVIDHFVKQWAVRYGTAYPFNGSKDATLMTSVLALCKTVDDVKASIDAYFKDGDKYYVGHTIAKFHQDLPKFKGRGAGSGGSRREGLPYKHSTGVGDPHKVIAHFERVERERGDPRAEGSTPENFDGQRARDEGGEV